MSFFEPVAELAATQNGAITRSQLRSCGLSDRQVRTLCARGFLVPTLPRVFVVAGTPNSWLTHLTVATLAVGPMGVASHRSAAGLWRLDRFRRRHFDIAVPGSSARRPPGVCVHESTALPARDRTVLDGVPVTTPTRTILDVGRYLGPTRLGALLDDAVRRDLTSYATVHERFAELAGRGRNGIATAREMLASRPVDAAVPDSPLELAALNLLVDAGIDRPVLHHRVQCGPIGYVLDLAWPDRLVALECDGFRFHRTPGQLDWDDQRRTALGLRGWLVLHTTRPLLKSRPDGLIADVRRALAQRAT